MRLLWAVWPAFRWAIGGLLVASGILQLIGLPGDIPTWLGRLRGTLPFAFTDGLFLNGLMIGLGLAVLFGPAITRRLSHRKRAGARAYVPRGFPSQVDDDQREREGETFPVVHPDFRTRDYSRREIDAMSFTQRQKLFHADPAMHDWWRGKRRDGSWSHFRLEGGRWFSKEEVGAMSQQERSDLLRGYANMVEWYLEDIKF